VKNAVSRKGGQRMVVARMLYSYSRRARPRDDCPAVLETASDRRRSEKTCKSHRGCSSLEQNNDKELSGDGRNLPRDEEPSMVE